MKQCRRRPLKVRRSKGVAALEVTFIGFVVCSPIAVTGDGVTTGLVDRSLETGANLNVSPVDGVGFDDAIAVSTTFADDLTS